MSCDNFENICIFCQDIDVKNDDNSMNMIETSEHNQNEHNQHEHNQNEHNQNEHNQNEHNQNEHNQNELIDYKHCLNIKVHPKCLCIWFIKQDNECLICRKKLDVSHNVLNDVNVFIVNIQKDDFSVIDIIYPYKHLSAEYRRANINELPPSDMGDDIRHIEVHNIMNVDEIDVDDILHDILHINVVSFIPILNGIKITLNLIIIYMCGVFVNIIYNLTLSAMSEIA